MKTAQRLHGLDGLRAFAMLMGIVVHASLPYWSTLGKISFFWPSDEDQSISLWIVFSIIHSWRMPLFFLLAGFFANLYLSHHDIRAFFINRLHRIVVPLVIFGAITAAILPPIWDFGFNGEFKLSGLMGFPGSPGFLGHLWFLYYLSIFYGLVIVGMSVPRLSRLKLDVFRPLLRIFYSPIPLPFTVLVMGSIIVINLNGQGESKSVWPLNVPDLLYHGIFFIFGFGLYYRPQLLTTLRTAWVFILLLLIATFSSLVQIASVIGIGYAKSPEEARLLSLIILISTSCASVLFCLGLIGLFQRILQRYVKRIRWLADSSYWIYIMHLPVVALTTFYLFRYDLQPEIKFMISCLVTLAIGLITYRYLIRYSPAGWLLNGR
ncbi:MAG: acyltransferase family protein [Chloroflexota bacterium]|nr:acyltransferase family protein [Chloroflexota bacterium]